MTREAFAETQYSASVLDGLRWTRKVPQAHAGGARSRGILLPLLAASPEIKEQQVILIDELFSTGGSLLASADCLKAAGAEVLGAITCGRTVYDFKTPAFGTQEFDLTAELADWPLA
jgi:adenine/guanine phosphoribosyltransferase-like PRPP-binding protein